MNVTDSDSSDFMEIDSEIQELKPRPYQISLYEEAIKQNSILFLPTGAGKTFIAVLVIRHFSGSIQKSLDAGGKRTIFIVNTVELVNQQTCYIAKHTGLICRGYSGDTNIEFWDKIRWRREFMEIQVMVVTAQIFLNILLQGFISLERINLMIFDECHRAVSNHPMRQIMQAFANYTIGQYPHILGMSASLLNSNVQQYEIGETLENLKKTFNANICTVESPDTVENFATNPKELIKYYEPLEGLEVVKIIRNIIDETKDILNLYYIPDYMGYTASSPVFRPDTKNDKIKRIMDDTFENIIDMGLYGGSYAIEHHIEQLECIKSNNTKKDLTVIIEYCITQLIKIQKYIYSEMANTKSEKEKIYLHSSPKVLTLLYSLLDCYNNLKEEKFCCIIFVKRRFTAQVLNDILNAVSQADGKFKFLKTDFLIGFNNKDAYRRPRRSGISETNSNKQVLKNFREGEKNCIVATDVVDEGIDVPNCTLVVRYYVPMDFRAYIQSKGRARHRSSNYILLVESDTNYELRYRNFKISEASLKKLHTEDNMRCLSPLSSKEDEDNIPPYIVEKSDGTRSIVTAYTAINLINFYCACLTKMAKVTPIPVWVLNTNSRGCQVNLKLPTASPLRETITGDEMDNVNDAKRSAALKACIRLHEIGELTDCLVPRKAK